jgi:hypothetical protein
MAQTVISDDFYMILRIPIINYVLQNPYHNQIIRFKQKCLTAFFAENDMISMIEFNRAAFDYVLTENAYFHIIKNDKNQVVRLQHISCPLLTSRRKNEAINFLELNNVNVFHIKKRRHGKYSYGLPKYIENFQINSNLSEIEVCKLHRINPVLLGLYTKKTMTSSDFEKAMDYFYIKQVKSMQQDFLKINDALDQEIIKFNERYEKPCL